VASGLASGLVSISRLTSAPERACRLRLELELELRLKLGLGLGLELELELELRLKLGLGLGGKPRARRWARKAAWTSAKRASARARRAA
jgi:hypothetical protein